MDKKQYTCHFYMDGGSCGEAEYELEAQFELTDEEYNQAIEALEECDGLNADLPDAMYEAIWEVAVEQLYEDVVDYNLEELDDIDDLIPGWEDMSTAELVEIIRRISDLRDELVDISVVGEVIGGISLSQNQPD